MGNTSKPGEKNMGRRLGRGNSGEGEFGETDRINNSSELLNLMSIFRVVSEAQG